MSNWERFRRISELVSKPTPERAVTTVRARVEQALQNPIKRKRGPARPNRFEGRFSTDPSRVSPEISKEFLNEKCGYLIVELADAYPGNLEISTTRGFHAYGIDRSVKPAIYVDPSLGQYVDGHTHIFVGTHEEVLDLLTRAREKASGRDREMILWLLDDYSFPGPYQDKARVPGGVWDIVEWRKGNDERLPSVWGSRDGEEQGELSTDK